MIGTTMIGTTMAAPPQQHHRHPLLALPSHLQDTWIQTRILLMCHLLQDGVNIFSTKIASNHGSKKPIPVHYANVNMLMSNQSLLLPMLLMPLDPLLLLSMIQIQQRFSHPNCFQIYIPSRKLLPSNMLRLPLLLRIMTTRTETSNSKSHRPKMLQSIMPIVITLPLITTTLHPKTTKVKHMMSFYEQPHRKVHDRRKYGLAFCLHLGPWVDFLVLMVGVVLIKMG
mmetsp:Transcript_26786/g.39635  ORF Transcript_26786/g.39635 Transcript_26786/m.39635 type:complete len:226 (+) Transcript_26786:679-1356(+)